MRTREAAETIDHDRGRFLGAAAIATVSLDFAMHAPARAGSRATGSAESVPASPTRASFGIGHNLPQEAPEAFAQAVIDLARS